MADNVTLPGTNQVVKTQDVAGVHYQEVLLPSKVLVSDEFTRPANTTAYAAKDVVGDGANMVFPGCVLQNGGSGYIISALLMTDQTTFAARLRLHLFHATPDVITDNSPFTLLFVDRTDYLGFIDLPAGALEGTGSTAASGYNVFDRIPFKCAAADDDLYGQLETLDVFTPASEQQFFIQLLVERD